MTVFSRASSIGFGQSLDMRRNMQRLQSSPTKQNDPSGNWDVERDLQSYHLQRDFWSPAMQ